MNFQLKDARSGGSVELNTGMYGAGDGESAQFAGNVGLPMGGSGFANLSLEYGNSNPTDRAATRRDAIALVAAGNTHVRSEHPQVWGDPDIDPLERGRPRRRRPACGAYVHIDLMFASAIDADPGRVS